ASYIGLDDVIINNGNISIRYEARVDVNNKTLNLEIGQNFTIVATTTPEGLDVTYVQDDSGVYIVDKNGVVTALKNGTGSVFVKIGGDGIYAKNSTIVNVTVSKVPTEISVLNDTLDLKVDGVVETGATLTPADAGNLTYTVSNPSIVKVENGKITALKEGNATITVSFAGNKKYLAAENKTINVTVRLNDASVKVNNNTLNLLVEDKFNLIATTEPKDLTVNFTSNNPSVVTVDNKGNVLAVGEGNATITVTVGGDGKYVENSTTVTVTVSKVPTEITVDPASLDLFVGDETVIAANLTPSDAGNVTFTSSDENIVAVDDKGNVIAEGKGQAIITVSFAGDNKYAAAENKTITVTVSLNDASVTVDNNTLDLKVDETYKINATKHPDTILLDITYTSSDESVATVDKNGVVTAHGEGTAIITLEVGDDEIYAKNSTAVTVTVSKIPTEINIENANVTLNVGDEVSTGAALNPEKAGNLTYKSDDESIAIVKDGKIIALKEGDAIITVSFAGDNKYAVADNKTIKVTVKKLNPIMDVSAEEITEGENATISVTLPDDATGNVTTTVNGKTYSSPVENGKAVITISDLEYGNYTLPVTYSGDDKYNPLTKDVNLTVKEDEIIVSALDLTKYYSGTEPFTVNVTYTNGRAIAGKEVKITINGITYTRTTDKNGTVSLNINLNAGTYDVAVEVDNISVDYMVTVLSTINASDIESKIKNLVFTASFIDGEGNYLTDGTNVSFNIKGVIYDSQVTGDKGLASINLTLDSGRYIITSYNPVSDEYASNSIAVDLKDVVMTLSSDEITVGENAIISVSLPDDAEGDVTATVNGKTYANNVNNGKANIIIPDLAAGNYTVPVIYSGDDKYNGAKGDANVTVNKADAAISIDAPPITEGDNATVTVTLPGDATGKVTVGNEIVTVKEGTASVVLTGLKAGITTVPVTYSGDDKYNPIETSVEVIVNEKPVPAKENLTIQATADEITEGENATLIITGLENATGNVSLIVNGKTYTAPVNNGEAVITVPGLTENVTAVVNYPGDDKYNSAVTTVNITVNRNTVTITAENLTKYYRDSQKFTVKVTDAKGQAAANKTVEITINGVTYKRTTDENGTAGLNINLNSGEYPVSVAVDDVTVNSTVTVMSTIDASDVVKMFRNDTQYNAIFTDVNGTALANITVSFNIQGIIYNRTTDAKGSAKLNINLNAGEYIITAVNPVTGEMKSNRIKVISLIESDDLTKYYRNSSQFVVCIHSADGGYVGAGEEVKFNINGVFYTRTTNATGHAKLNINLGQGNYTVTTYYKDCGRGNNIEVLPILSADDLVMKYRDGSQFKAKLVDGQGKAYAGQNVQFNINGVFYNRATDSTGTAKLNINLMPGEYIITSSYNGSSIANKITVKS
ncbi:Ig-like domain repeat protein, partial [Methanobrevibacter sp.]|uniref:Ig-like domain repeat protein n=1 Tax=Methanobrevibacter sp. TaxID=66852 RepID=UPI00388D4242